MVLAAAVDVDDSSSLLRVVVRESVDSSSLVRVVAGESVGELVASTFVVFGDV